MTQKNGTKSKKPAKRRRSLGKMSFEKEDLQLIHKALSAYAPTEEEANLHMILVESFDEVLECEYADGAYYDDRN